MQVEKVLFIVERHGVYQQGIVGLFEDKKQAIVEAKEAARNESDDYHCFYVSTLKLNEVHKFEYTMSGQGRCSPECCKVIAKIDRKGLTIKVEIMKE